MIVGAGTPDVPRIKLGVVEDRPVVRVCLSRWLTETTGDIRVAATTESWADLLRHPSFPVDIVLVSAGLSDGVPFKDRVSAAAAVGCSVVVLGTDQPGRADGAESGASAVVSLRNEPAEIVAVIRRSHDRHRSAGGPVPAARRMPHLSVREREALALYATGLSMKQVATRLHIRFDTAKGYVDSVRRKYAEVDREARTKIELRRRAQEDGLIDPW
jgi:DNA-binding NarL/FixJ family response regulator